MSVTHRIYAFDVYTISEYTTVLMFLLVPKSAEEGWIEHSSPFVV
jgi:hypothetical protein